MTKLEIVTVGFAVGDVSAPDELKISVPIRLRSEEFLAGVLKDDERLNDHWVALDTIAEMSKEETATA